MAKTTQNYSANAASNTALIAPDGTQIPLGEGQTLPKHVNDAFRALMADTAIAAKFSGLPAGRSTAVAVKLVANTDTLGSFPAVGGQKLELDGAVNPALVLAGTTAAPHTYTFDTSDSSMTGALRFYEDASQTTEYTTGVTVSSGQTTIAVTDTAPKVLYYQLAGSAGLGGIAYVLGVTGQQQTAAEIKTAYESNADTNAFTDAEQTKLAGIETGATADQTGAEIKALYEAETNAFTDAQFTKLAGIETGATADQTDAEIKTAYENNSDTNAFTDAEKTKLSNINQGVATTDDVTFADLTLTGYLAGPATFTIDPAVVGDDTGKVVIAGNLQVDGDTTTVNSTTVEVGDKNIVLGADATADTQNHGAGITVSRPDSTDAGISWDETNDEWGVTNGLNVAGTVTADGLNLGDNDVATFGAGNDLQIYHDGSNSFIADLGTGLLQLRTNGPRIELVGQSGSEYMARFEQDGPVKLFYDAVQKLATTSAGVDVTGTVTADDSITIARQSVAPALFFENSSYSGGDAAIKMFNAGQMVFETDATTQMVLDAAGNVGIGNANPATALDVTGDITVSGNVDGRDVAADGTKLDGIETGADVTDAANVTAAGALMDSEVTNLAQVKAFDSADYATAAQGALADTAVQPSDERFNIRILAAEETLPSGYIDTGGVLTDSQSVTYRVISKNLPSSIINSGTEGGLISFHAVGDL